MKYKYKKGAAVIGNDTFSGITGKIGFIQSSKVAFVFYGGSQIMYYVNFSAWVDSGPIAVMHDEIDLYEI